MGDVRGGRKRLESFQSLAHRLAFSPSAGANTVQLGSFSEHKHKCMSDPIGRQSWTAKNVAQLVSASPLDARIGSAFTRGENRNQALRHEKTLREFGVPRRDQFQTLALGQRLAILPQN